MLTLQLYVEGKEVELFKDESITLNQGIQEIRDISKIFIDYTKTFSVPASKANNKIFRHFYNFNIDGFDARYKKSAELQLNYKPFKKGKIKLESATLKENKPHTYKVTFFGDTVNLKDTLGEDKISLLSQLNNFSFDYTDANIAGFMVGGKDANILDEQIVDGIIFPLITHTDRLVYKSNTAADVGTSKNIWYDASGTYGVPFTQLKPALRVYTIIRAIEAQYPSITFSSDFFSTTNAPFFDLYMWLHTNEGEIDANIQRQVQATPITLKGGDTDDMPDFNAGTKLVNTTSGTDNPRFLVLEAQNLTSTTNPYSIIVKRNGQQIFSFINRVSRTINGETIEAERAELEMPNGEYTFFIESDTAGDFKLNITVEQKSTDQFTATKKVNFEATCTVSTTGRIEIPTAVPDLKILDFLTSLFKMFNLTAFQDADGTIVVKTLDSFYSDSTVHWDITKHLDKKSKIIDTTIPYKQLNFKYEETETFFANQHKELSKIEWGALEYMADTEKRAEGSTYDVEIPFEHMKFERLIDITDNTNTSFQWGWSVDDSQNSYLGEPLLFYVANATGAIAAVNLAGSKVQVTNPYIPANAVTNTTCTSAGTQNLNFNAEINEYCQVVNTKSLFETYYKTYITDLFDKRKRLTKVKAYLPLSITQQINLADKIIVFDDLYKINKLSTNFATNLSSIELTNVLGARDYRTLNYVSGEAFTADSIDVKASNAIITSDSSINNDGFTIPNVTTVSPFADNYPVSNTDQQLTVTAATVSFVSASATSSSLTFIFNISALGKIGSVDYMAEYGLLYATAENKLVSTDLATLRATSGVTDQNFITPEAIQTTGNKSISIVGLSSGVEYYAKFYVRTNTNPVNAFADVVTSVQTKITT